MYDVADVTVCAFWTSEVIWGSFAIATSYCTEPSNGFQLRSSGCVGNEIDALSAGDSSVGPVFQCFVNERVTQRDVCPFFRTARTRHQYFPSCSVCRSVAEVLHVWKLPAPP